MSIAIVIVFCLLILCEYIVRTKTIHHEFVRKSIHIGVGTFVAFWPFFLSWQEIQIIGVAFFIAVLVSAKLRLFRAVHRKEGGVVGELLFATVITVLAFIQPDAWIFTIAILQLSLADGLAAIMGTRWGKTNHYTIFGKVKSIVGSMTFLITSFCVCATYVVMTDENPGLLVLITLPIMATIVEGISIKGTDNFTVPVLTALLLIIH